MNPSSRYRLLASALAVFGCTRTPPPDAADAGASDVLADDAPADVPASDAGLVGVRPYRKRIPRSYDSSRPTPLVILLHGYGASGMAQDLYFRLGALAEERGFLYAYPDGTVDASGRRFWNATDACCDFAHSGVDDVAYITAIIDDMSARYNVDERRIYLVGHSNGGFMSHRMACELSTRVAAIVSLAGANWLDSSRCKPSSPVAVLQIHGDADTIIAYDGGTTASFGGGPYPGARATVAGWAMRNGCGSALESTGMMLDLVPDIPGAETRVEAHRDCRAGAAELWTIQGGGHVPGLQPSFAATIYDWLSAHPRP